jgi:hypothetical protein
MPQIGGADNLSAAPGAAARTSDHLTVAARPPQRQTTRKQKVRGGCFRRFGGDDFEI